MNNFVIFLELKLIGLSKLCDGVGKDTQREENSTNGFQR